MRLVVTDSGLGGLSVCADLLKAPTGPAAKNTELLYVNTAPDPRRSYNSMESLAEKQEVFQTFLHRLTDSYQPDHIFVACHTLSALLPEIKLPEIPIQGMLELTRKAVLEKAKEFGYSRLLILATPTTISSGVYDQLLPDTQSIVCPGLADMISSDVTGTRIIENIRLFLSGANPRLSPGKVIVVLGCTHYGWRENLQPVGGQVRRLRDYRPRLRHQTPGSGRHDGAGIAGQPATLGHCRRPDRAQL